MLPRWTLGEVRQRMGQCCWEGGVEPGVVQRGVDAADDGDAEGAASRRVESLTADPTPAWSAATAPMMDSVAGAEVRPMPRPYTTIWMAIVR